MKRFLIALAVLALATLLILVSFWDELTTDDPAAGIEVSVEVNGDDSSRLLISLDNDPDRKLWETRDDDYWVRVERERGGEFHFLVAQKVLERTYRVDTAVALEPGEAQRIAAFGAEGPEAAKSDLPLFDRRTVEAELIEE